MSVIGNLAAFGRELGNFRFISGETITDGTSVVLSFSPGGIYMLVCTQWTTDGGARQGRQISWVIAPEEGKFGTTAGIRETFTTGGTARVTYTLNSDSTLTIVRNGASYSWKYALFRLDGEGEVSSGGGSPSELPAYTGTYSVTPTTSTQTLSTANLRMTADLEVEPIPSDWGHIGFDGSVITVT